MNSKLYIGTSGYSYKDWEGVLYPPGTRQTDYLSIYSQEFNVAELNYSYYRMPDANAGRKMVEQTSDNFILSVKAHKSLTHEYALSNLDTNCGIFLDGIAPFAEANKLGAALLQFPYSFHYTKENRVYLDTLCKRMSEVPLCVEFRNDKWLTDSVYRELGSRDIGFVNVDEPAIKGLPKPDSLVTSGIGYIRFHGRNIENWWSGDNVSRYDYCYSEDELKEWMPSIERIMQHARILLVVFNNHSKGQAVRNARQLRDLYIDKNTDQDKVRS